MQWLTTSLRVATLGAVVFAVGDPGCPGPVRPRLALTFAGEWPDDARTSALQRIRASTPWADVVAPDGEGRVDATLVAGDAAPVLAHLSEHAAALAIRMEGTPLEITAVDLPTQVTVGSRVAIDVHLQVTGSPPAGVRVTVADEQTGVTEATVDHRDTWSGVVVVDWLAVREGPRRLKVRAEPLDATSARPSPWVDVSIDVAPGRFRTHLLEARPTWVGRFTRLALAAGGDTGLSLEVRAAPGVTLQRREDAGAQLAEASADVVVVSGVEALTGGDVARLERLVRAGGRVLVLLLDEAPRDGPWRRLWGGDLGRVASASTPRVVALAGARWRTREWLAGVSSTDAVALAYVDEGPPVVLVRSMGEGRVVLVSALDAWRWRAEPDVAWREGWQALIRRLAADVPPPVAVTAWVSGSGTDRVVQIEARARGDVPVDAPTLDARLADEAGVRHLKLAAVQTRRWRGAARVASDGAQRVAVTVPTAPTVEVRGTAVVHVGRAVRPAGWHEVRRHQEERGAAAADVSALAGPLAALRTRLTTDDGPRWFVTRTWWYAALVLAGLGSEWVIRRARRLA